MLPLCQQPKNSCLVFTGESSLNWTCSWPLTGTDLTWHAQKSSTSTIWTVSRLGAQKSAQFPHLEPTVALSVSVTWAYSNTLRLCLTLSFAHCASLSVSLPHPISFSPVPPSLCVSLCLSLSVFTENQTNTKVRMKLRVKTIALFPTICRLLCSTNVNLRLTTCDVTVYFCFMSTSFSLCHTPPQKAPRKLINSVCNLERTGLLWGVYGMEIWRIDSTNGWSEKRGVLLWNWSFIMASMVPCSEWTCLGVIKVWFPGPWTGLLLLQPYFRVQISFTKQ